MFAVDFVMPINALFALFVLLCVAACVVGQNQTPRSDRTEDEVPAAFHDMPELTDVSTGTNGHNGDGARHGMPGEERTGRGA